MPKRTSTDHFIRREFSVTEADATTTHSHRRSRTRFDSQKENIFLVGLRGSGKSTLGQALAERLDLQLVDTDAEVVARSNASISDLVAEKGWEGFRRIEHEVLVSVCQQAGQVVATGGGIILLPQNRNLLVQHGQVFYLMADLPLLVDRLRQDPQQTNRPALGTAPPEEELRVTFQEREPLYFQVMNHILRADKPVDGLVQDAVMALGLSAWEAEEEHLSDLGQEGSGDE